MSISRPKYWQANGGVVGGSVGVKKTEAFNLEEVASQGCKVDTTAEAVVSCYCYLFEQGMCFKT